MTEVRPMEWIDAASSSSSCDGVGLFVSSKQKYLPGDTILQETTPLVTLAPISAEQEAKVLSELITVKNSATPSLGGKGGKKKNARRKHNNYNGAIAGSSVWDSITVPASVPKEHRGKFKGMVQSALVYASCCSFGFNSNSDSSTEEVPATAAISDATAKKLLQLYHPPLTQPNEAEKAVVELSKTAINYLKKNCAQNSRIKKHFLSVNSNCADGAVTIQKIMLIWACNAFEGGRIYANMSRANHSCDPNAIVTPLSSATIPGANSNKTNGGQILKSVGHLSPPKGEVEEVTISYLGLLLYAETAVRREALLRDKFFVCQCPRCGGCGSDGQSCVVADDKAASIPCPACHPRQAPLHRQLEEDDQYDDDLSVHYAWPQASGGGKQIYKCESCHATFSEETKSFQQVRQDMRTVTSKVVTFLQDYEARRNRKKEERWKEKNNVTYGPEEKDEEALENELLEQHLEMTSSIVGARHWTTNLLLVLQLDITLHTIHAKQLKMYTTGGSDNSSEAEAEKEETVAMIAQAIDSLERVCRFIRGLGLSHFSKVGHVLSGQIIGVARALVSLGDVKSQKYAAEWLAKIDGDNNDGDGSDDENNYVKHFEPEGIQKVVAALKVAWKRSGEDGGGDGNDSERQDGGDSDQRKRAKAS